MRASAGRVQILGLRRFPAQAMLEDTGGGIPPDIRETG